MRTPKKTVATASPLSTAVNPLAAVEFDTDGTTPGKLRTDVEAVTKLAVEAVINDVFQTARDELAAIMLSHRLRLSSQRQQHADLLAGLLASE